MFILSLEDLKKNKGVNDGRRKHISNIFFLFYRPFVSWTTRLLSVIRSFPWLVHHEAWWKILGAGCVANQPANSVWDVTGCSQRLIFSDDLRHQRSLAALQHCVVVRRRELSLHGKTRCVREMEPKLFGDGGLCWRLDHASDVMLLLRTLYFWILVAGEWLSRARLPFEPDAHSYCFDLNPHDEMLR